MQACKQKKTEKNTAAASNLSKRGGNTEHECANIHTKKEKKKERLQLLHIHISSIQKRHKHKQTNTQTNKKGSVVAYLRPIQPQ